MDEKKSVKKKKKTSHIPVLVFYLLEAEMESYKEALQPRRDKRFGSTPRHVV